MRRQTRGSSSVDHRLPCFTSPLHSAACWRSVTTSGRTVPRRDDDPDGRVDPGRRRLAGSRRPLRRSTVHRVHAQAQGVRAADAADLAAAVLDSCRVHRARSLRADPATRSSATVISSTEGRADDVGPGGRGDRRSRGDVVGRHEAATDGVGDVKGPPACARRARRTRPVPGRRRRCWPGAARPGPRVRASSVDQQLLGPLGHAVDPPSGRVTVEQLATPRGGPPRRAGRSKKPTPASHSRNFSSPHGSAGSDALGQRRRGRAVHLERRAQRHPPTLRARPAAAGRHDGLQRLVPGHRVRGSPLPTRARPRRRAGRRRRRAGRALARWPRSSRSAGGAVTSITVTSQPACQQSRRGGRADEARTTHEHGLQPGVPAHLAHLRASPPELRAPRGYRWTLVGCMPKPGRRALRRS